MYHLWDGLASRTELAGDNLPCVQLFCPRSSSEHQAAGVSTIITLK